MIFPKEATDYLRRRKGEYASRLYQVRRGYKQLSTLLPLLRHYMPSSVLDIGCGLGCVDVLLASSGVGTIHLMDGDGSGLRRDDYARDVEAWNDVHLAEEMVRLNSPAGTTVHAHYANPDLQISVGMIISFKSWGTHYPVVTYLPLARRCLTPGGYLVLDLRWDVDTSEDVREIVDAGFENYKRLSERQWAFKRCA
jgi:SAM-dependent methyltransferase